MRLTLHIVAATAALLVGAAPSGAHLITKPKADTLSATAKSQAENLAHARYVCRKGGGDHKRWSCAAVKWLERELGETRAKLEVRLDPRSAIRAVFGPYASQALAVSYCETGGTYDIYADNGQYLGLFQMGEWERATYGHGWTAIAQARAAYRYFVASGRDWGPWECKP